jgi:hypothetical protein
MTDKEYHRQWYQLNKDYLSRKRRKDSTSPTYRRQVLYSVWNNETDEVVIIDGNCVECAKAMGISPKSFHAIMMKSMQGKIKKWTFEKRLIREMNADE